MEPTSELGYLAAHLTACGLTVSPDGTRRLNVVNPISHDRAEHVTDQVGSYVTDYGYELGRRGDETGTAGRLAYLLRARSPAVPTARGKSGAPSGAHRPNGRGTR